MRHRLNLAVSDRVRERLAHLQEMTEAENVTEVIRRSLALYEELLEFQASGGRVVLKPKKGEPEALWLT